MSTEPSSNVLRIAIIGGGPAGLGAAIALSRLPNVKITLYEKARELREVGAGINIGYNCWKVLELLGAAEEVRGHAAQNVLHRNAISGEIRSERPAQSSLPPKYRSHRVRRTRLQSALISKVPQGIIQLNRRLVSLHDELHGVRLIFEDGDETIADLVLGGDGIRSVVRLSLFPDHVTKFTGTTIWRTLVPAKLCSDIPNLVPETSWWHGPAGHCYFSLVDDPSEFSDSNNSSEQMLEISCRYLTDPALDTERRFSWGIPATNERVTVHFKDYDPRPRESLSRVPEGNWKEFSAFAGPRLDRLIGWGKVALLGDSSHPLTGAFGSGAAFAMEDGWILAQAIEYTTNRRLSTDQGTKAQNIADALEIFNEIRSPYYRRMYEHIDNQKAKTLQARAKAESESSDPTHIFEGALQARLDSFTAVGEMDWIYRNDIGLVWQDYLRREKLEDSGIDLTASNL
ncbi:putative FAD-binding monooxygenase [Talaromyces proteolyticus]|uniref:FAD-binding monooxygenase n=1 Tax=Talaromyces proteolyticus TaxID=1131652 RepID=A0AAD4KH96_9EURO|nr:putative FAD-binding monooxygenase [Talaromyces proteolyticus]KAH8691159.1 putative FAD-binding monooxygenase [Talaromyces proteolyticus]